VSDIETYRRLLRPNKHRLDDELEIQAEVMDRISDSIANVARLAAEAADNLKLVEARLFRELKDADEKLTDKAADSAVRRHPERVRAFERMTSANQQLNEWQGLHEAWKARGYSINKLCDLYVAQYFTKNSYSISDRSDRRRGEEAALRDRPPYRGGNHSEGSTPRRRINEG
jgi:hypothetical protein